MCLSALLLCMQDTTAQQRAQWRELGLQLLAQVGASSMPCTLLVG
jgi:hypothetical protein